MNYLIMNNIIMGNIYYKVFDQYDDNLICTDNGKFEKYCQIMSFLYQIKNIFHLNL